jgi:endonuclease YncB( thermonuclease family)
MTGGRDDQQRLARGEPRHTVHQAIADGLSSCHTALFALVLIAPLSVLAAPAADREDATVLGVRNGQELEVEVDGTPRRVRLACLQAPRPQQQPWARQARQQLEGYLKPGTRVTLELRARDVFGRVVAVVRRNGDDVALPLLRRGAVFAYGGYLGRCDDLGYGAAEAEARRQLLGVWSRTGGIERPWDLMLRRNDSEEEP